MKQLISKRQQFSPFPDIIFLLQAESCVTNEHFAALRVLIGPLVMGQRQTMSDVKHQCRKEVENIKFNQV